MVRLILALSLSFLLSPWLHAEFKAGAFAQDISPTTFPVPVNGSMRAGFATGVHDPLHARCLALHDGERALVFCVLDVCGVSREICEEAKDLASKATGIPKTQMLISATHTHSAPALIAVFQSEIATEYAKGVPALIAKGIAQAVKNLEPAEFGWAFGSDPSQVFNRRWHMKEGAAYENPFGIMTDRARMNPGNVNPENSVPTGPVDQDVAVLAVRSAGADKRPIGVLANYSLHYVGGYPALSADYYGAFANEMAQRLKAGDERYAGKPAFVGIMSNGTSGDINNVNFGASIRRKRNPGEQIEIVARSVAEAAMEAYDSIKWQTESAIDTEETELQLAVRKGSPADVAQAKEWLETFPKDKDGQYADKKAVYARETLKLVDYPDTVPVKLQTHRIGTLSVGAIPCETFVEIGLRLKKHTPFTRHFTISLANGYNGYLPTAEQHALGGYETWRARSSYLEVDAAEKISSCLEEMLKTLKSRAGKTP